MVTGWIGFVVGLKPFESQFKMKSSLVKQHCRIIDIRFVSNGCSSGIFTTKRRGKWVKLITQADKFFTVRYAKYLHVKSELVPKIVEIFSSNDLVQRV